MTAPAKHTPGPYSVTTMDMDADDWAQLHSKEIVIVKRTGHEDVLAAVWTDDDHDERAQARLFGAAPDLLAACKAQHEAIDLLFAMLATRDPEFFPTKSPAWAAAVAGHAAIAKAEKP